MTEQVYLQLREGLLLGMWKPGEKLTARGLSRTLGVSLTPAREAITRLATEGAITVSETRMYSIPELDRAQYEEITRVRLQLEPLATSLAVKHAKADFADHLDHINENLKARILAEDFDEGLRLDSEFHLTIYDAAGSTVLRRMIDTLWLQIGPTRNLLSAPYRKRLVGFQNHRRVIAAFRDRNEAEAHEAMKEDLTQGAAALMAILP
ncbi:GntR family transcriptional regulator [Aquamicrobium sp. NLF2-7]|uniref:GntR family transcriptional regulator n=1 Tax=Aquamicrobium sp. NLF2-7 TaxID=2918753 RepID=UPI001EFAB508|nr:GntR family transcriptional regulator [Aquamicrobium sp. NLF2-7]MCG8272071.1 GntR family transcriptional regulator [Aquamicrobium sp. NLF2-7]